MADRESRKRVRFHVKAGDYFGTLATVLDLLRQRMEDKGYGRKDAKLLKELLEDILYLQEEYGIVKCKRPTKPSG